MLLQGCFFTAARIVCACALLATPPLLLGCTQATELRVVDEKGTPVTVRQQPHGNTLVVDLQDVTGRGELVLERANAPWPKHLVIRVRPGSVHGVLIRGEAAMQFTPVADTDPVPRDIRLERSLYSGRTKQITVRWQ